MTSDRDRQQETVHGAETLRQLSDGPERLLGMLLSSVAHDLKSPLIALSLGAELLAETEVPQQRAIASDSIRQGVRDMERMLDAVAAVSASRRQPLQLETITVGDALAGVEVESTTAGWEGRSMTVDRQFMLHLVEFGGGPGNARAGLDMQADAVAITIAAPESTELPSGSPLAALLSSLHEHAGTAVQDLAVLQLLSARQDGDLSMSADGVTVTLPLQATKEA